MRKIVLFKIGSKNAELPRLVGAFLLVVSVLMLFQSGAVMFDSWQAVKGFNGCVDDAYSINAVDDPTLAVLSELKYQDCKESLYQITGAQVTGGQKYLTSRQFWTAFMGPIGNIFIWAIVLLIAMLLFNNSSIVIPVEQVEIPLNVESKKIVSIKKKKK